MFDINYINFWYIIFPNSKEIKAKFKKQDLITRKIFYIAKETTNKAKRQPTKWDKLFVNDMSNKKWADELNIYFSKKEMKVANKHMKRYSTSLIIREIKSK